MIISPDENEDSLSLEEDSATADTYLGNPGTLSGTLNDLILEAISLGRNV